MSYLGDVAPTGHRVAMALLSLLFALEVLCGLAILTMSECVVTGPDGDMHMTSCVRENPWQAPIFLVVVAALYTGTRWLEGRDRPMGLLALGALVTGPILFVILL